MAYKNKQDARDYGKKWYYENRERRIAGIYANNKRRKQAIQKNVLDYLRIHPCLDCGITNPIVLEFDHINDDKKDGIAQLIVRGFGWEVVKAEIAKCEVVCANCHRLRTAKRGKFFKYSEVA